MRLSPTEKALIGFIVVLIGSAFMDLKSDVEENRRTLAAEVDTQRRDIASMKTDLAMLRAESALTRSESKTTGALMAALARKWNVRTPPTQEDEQ